MKVLQIASPLLCLFSLLFTLMTYLGDMGNSIRFILKMHIYLLLVGNQIDFDLEDELGNFLMFPGSFPVSQYPDSFF